MLAALASVLLASCTTSGNQDELFGFSAAMHAPGPSVQDMASLQGESSLSATTPPSSAAGVFIVEDGDPALPDAVEAAPALRPVSSEEEALLAQAQQAMPQPQAATDEESAQVAAAVPEADAPAAASHPPPAAFAATAQQPKKPGFFASLFGNKPQPAGQAARPLVTAATPALAAGDQAAPQPAEPATPLIQLASAGEPPRPLAAGVAGQSALPGVRQNSLYEISRRSGIDEDDIDVYEDEPVQVASAAGLARLAPNGLLTQTEHVDVACLKPSLVRTLKSIERHFGSKVTVTSGYRNPTRNRRARGARNSLHMYCAAADVKVEGVSKAQLASFARSMPGRGGVGTYCHTDAVHIDVGPERDWNWRCRRRK